MSLYEWLTLLVMVLTVEQEKGEPQLLWSGRSMNENGENLPLWLREAVWDRLHPFFLFLFAESAEVCKEGGRQW